MRGTFLRFPISRPLSSHCLNALFPSFFSLQEEFPTLPRPIGPFFLPSKSFPSLSASLQESPTASRNAYLQDERLAGFSSRTPPSLLLRVFPPSDAALSLKELLNLSRSCSPVSYLPCFSTTQSLLLPRRCPFPSSRSVVRFYRIFFATPRTLGLPKVPTAST